MKVQKVVTVTAGHSNTDSGAVNGKIHEQVVATDARNIVAWYLQSAGITVRMDGLGKENRPLREAVKLVKGSDIALEMHCNAAVSPKAKGVEVLANPRHKGLAQRIAQSIAGVIGTPVRGDKGYKPENSGQHSRLAYVQAGGLVVEMFFISNQEELDAWDNKKWLVCKAIANVLIEELK
jgi:N-acetylmuramoyl-L-alanine amidase